MFRENHISYNPSRTCKWTPDFTSKVILEHCKSKDMTRQEASYFCLKKFSEIEDYGMKYYHVKTEDSNKSVIFGIGIDCLKIKRDNITERIPYTCLRMATHSRKTVTVDIYSNELGDVESIGYRIDSKESACAFYRAITEHCAFYRCDSIHPAVKEQVTRVFIDTVLSFFHDDKSTEQNYIFDTERTSRKAYNHARRILYNFGGSTTAAMTWNIRDENQFLNTNTEDILEEKVNALHKELDSLKESFYCSICCQDVINVDIYI